MPHAAATRLPSADELATLSAAQMVELVHQLTQTISALELQVEWFKRQLFGSK